jgi:DNA topoisomerase VI subunit A
MPIVINSKSLLVVTAKGYPDFATRKFLSLLSNAGKQLFYIGDADPFGAEIFFTYCFGSLKFAICEQL